MQKAVSATKTVSLSFAIMQRRQMFKIIVIHVRDSSSFTGLALCGGDGIVGNQLVDGLRKFPEESSCGKCPAFLMMVWG